MDSNKRMAEFRRVDKELSDFISRYALMPKAIQPEPGIVGMSALSHAVSLIYTSFNQQRGKARDFISDAIDARLDELEIAMADMGGSANVDAVAKKIAERIASAPPSTVTELNSLIEAAQKEGKK